MQCLCFSHTFPSTLILIALFCYWHRVLLTTNFCCVLCLERSYMRLRNAEPAFLYLVHFFFYDLISLKCDSSVECEDSIWLLYFFLICEVPKSLDLLICLHRNFEKLVTELLSIVLKCILSTSYHIHLTSTHSSNELHFSFRNKICRTLFTEACVAFYPN